MTMLTLLLLAASGSGAVGAILDTQTVTTGATGTVLSQNRVSGFNISPVIGSISDGTSNIYAGAAVQSLYWSENAGAPIYFLAIAGATNSGWTKVVVDGSLVLTRESATFTSGAWTWSTANNAINQIFGAAASTHICVFS